jgi:hypothetical protein
MTDTRIKRADGVRTLKDLRSRCVIDDETGCWMWGMSMSCSKARPKFKTPRVYIPAGVFGDAKVHNTTAQKAAWLLSGNTIPDGHVVWRKHCGRHECVNPAHAHCSTRQEMHKGIAESGRLRGDPLRAVINAKNCSVQILPRELVQQAEALFAMGVRQKDIRDSLGISSDTLARIRRGRHPNSTGAVKVLQGASVFSLGGRRT